MEASIIPVTMAETVVAPLKAVSLLAQMKAESVKDEGGQSDSSGKTSLIDLVRCTVGLNHARKLLQSTRQKRVEHQQNVLKKLMQLKLGESSLSVSSGSESDGSTDDEGKQAEDDPAISMRDDDEISEVDGGEAELRKILQRRLRRRQKVLKFAEQYTDSTRNAAVLLGEQDIKLSLWHRRRAVAALAGLPGSVSSAGSVAATAAARGLVRAGRPAAALRILDHALQLEPLSGRLLLARSDCHLLLGQPRLALLDAQEALELRSPPAEAQLRKAQALYALGHFERALVLFHRGLKARPSCAAFRLGVQRAQEAIEDTVAGMDDALRLPSPLPLEDTWMSEDAVLKRPKEKAEVVLPDAIPPAVPAAAAAFLSRLGNAVGRFVGDPDSGPTWAPRRVTAADAGEPAHMCDSCNTRHRLPPPPPPGPPPLRSPANVVEKKASVVKPLRAKTPAATQHSTSARAEPEWLRKGERLLPPALGSDLAFLEYVAELQDGRISALAGDAVVFLKNRKLFWQRRGPIATEVRRPKSYARKKRP